jgi:hypothetical protein
LKNFPYSITKLFFSFLIAFCSGNFFGLCIKQNNNQFFLILLTLSILEYISYISEKSSKKPIIYYMNIYKRGFLIGIFVEAFKVGS